MDKSRTFWFESFEEAMRLTQEYEGSGIWRVHQVGWLANRIVVVFHLIDVYHG